MKWNKAYLRKTTEEEHELYKIDLIWDGEFPELFEEVIVTEGKDCRFSVDTWIEFDNGIGFEYTDADIVYWMSIPRLEI